MRSNVTGQLKKKKVYWAAVEAVEQIVAQKKKLR